MIKALVMLKPERLGNGNPPYPHKAGCLAGDVPFDGCNGRRLHRGSGASFANKLHIQSLTWGYSAMVSTSLFDSDNESSNLSTSAMNRNLTAVQKSLF